MHCLSDWTLWCNEKGSYDYNVLHIIVDIYKFPPLTWANEKQKIRYFILTNQPKKISMASKNTRL